LFVASFIGSPAMNLYEAALEREAVVVGSQRIPVPGGAGLRGRPGLAAYQGRKVIVGVRPEDLVVGAGGSEAAALAADVRLVEALGSEQLVHFTMDAPQVRGDETASGADGSGGATGVDGDHVAEGEILAAPVANGVAVTPPRLPVRAGDRVRFTVDYEALHFFDPDTHLAID
jgi:multiple sugar transport system ATP-binding protein